MLPGMKISTKFVKNFAIQKTIRKFAALKDSPTATYNGVFNVSR